MTTIDVALRQAASTLASAGVASPRADAEQLAAHVLRLPIGEVQAAAVIGRALAPDDGARFAQLVEARADRVPLQHLTGRAAFRRLELAVGPGVFVPRAETEVAAGLAIEAASGFADELTASGAGGEVLVVDLCTGSGAIALAVATEVPGARVVAVELEPHAHAWARRNVDALAPGRVDLRLGDAAGADTGVLADLAGRVDVLVANPPYIPAGMRPVEVEVAEHDPSAALYGGGEDGLVLPRAVVTAAARLLRPGGVLVMEHADTQGAATRAIAGPPCWLDARTAGDLTGRDRVLLARRAGVRGATAAQVRDFAT